MAGDRWVIAYDLDTNAAKTAAVTVATVYNRIRTCLEKEGFNEFAQLSVYSMPDLDGALVKVYSALQALAKLDERRFIKRLHVFKIDGALNDVLPIVDKRESGKSLSADEVAA